MNNAIEKKDEKLLSVTEFNIPENIDEIIRIKDEISIMASKDSRFMFNESMETFLKMCRCFIMPQSYGARIQNKIIELFELNKLSSHNDIGDASNKNDVNFEIKVSFRQISNEYSFLQIRPYQKTDYYMLMAIDKNENYKQYYFIIPKKDLTETYKEKLGLSNCHGVDKNKKDKSNNEFRFSVQHGSDNWKFLCENYLVIDTKTYVNDLIKPDVIV